MLFGLITGLARVRASLCGLAVAFAVILHAGAGGPPPLIVVPPLSISVLLLDTATFEVVASSSTTMSYQWYKDGAKINGATSRSYSILSVQRSDAGSYTVKVSNSGGTVTSAAATLTVLAPPVITSSPTNATLVVGQSVAFSATATGALTYQWQKNGANLSLATGSSLTLPTVSTNDAAEYRVIAGNQFGASTSAVATLTVLVPPFITKQPQSAAVLERTAASFPVLASGTSPLSYQWYLNNKKLGPAQEPTLVISDMRTDRVGDYYVVVQNSVGTVTSAVATVSILVRPAITQQPTNCAVLEGGDASFSVAAGGSGSLRYEWFFNSTSLGASNATSALSIPDAAGSQAGPYHVVVSSEYGSVTSAVASLTVTVRPSIISQPQSQARARGQNAIFAVTATGTEPMVYQWFFNGLGLAGATNSSWTVTNSLPPNAGEYRVILSNAAGVVTGEVATLTVTNPIVCISPMKQILGTEGFKLQFPVPAGVTYVIEATSDFTQWHPLITNVAISNLETFTDAEATNFAARIYRVVFP